MGVDSGTRIGFVPLQVPRAEGGYSIVADAIEHRSESGGLGGKGSSPISLIEWGMLLLRGRPSAGL
jgi:hypothetical protein